MRPMRIGYVLPLIEDLASGEPIRWDGMVAQARRAEALGFDTVWVPDELLWISPEWPGPRGWWEGVAVAGAIAAATERIGVGTWVLSALHRNPALTAKVAETLDEISGGRFILGFGAGHAGRQGEMFGFPADRVISRYEEALQVLVPLLREGRAEFDGAYHRARGLEHRPRGPRPGQIPIMLGAHGRRTMALAVAHADTWSCFATESSLPDAFDPYLELLATTCAEAGRDPASIGRSVGVVVEPTDDHTAGATGLGVPISGTPDEIAGALRALGDRGFTSVELMLWPQTTEALEGFAPVIAQLDAG